MPAYPGYSQLSPLAFYSFPHCPVQWPVAPCLPTWSHDHIRSLASFKRTNGLKSWTCVISPLNHLAQIQRLHICLHCLKEYLPAIFGLLTSPGTARTSCKSGDISYFCQLPCASTGKPATSHVGYARITVPMLAYVENQAGGKKYASHNRET